MDGAADQFNDSNKRTKVSNFKVLFLDDNIFIIAPLDQPLFESITRYLLPGNCRKGTLLRVQRR
jgi:hypothetical protein